jgi:hypothetical protein
VERSNGMPGNFIPLCKLAANNSLHYFYKDSVPLVAPAYYRIQIILNNGSVLYSNAVLLKNNLRQPVIQIYPNPVQQELSIEINGIVQTNYAVDIHSAIGKKIFHGEYFKIQKDIIKIRRDNTIADGLYIIVVTDLQSGQQVNYKIIFQ